MSTGAATAAIAKVSALLQPILANEKARLVLTAVRGQCRRACLSCVVCASPSRLRVSASRLLAALSRKPSKTDGDWLRVCSSLVHVPAGCWRPLHPQLHLEDFQARRGTRSRAIAHCLTLLCLSVQAGTPPRFHYLSQLRKGAFDFKNNGPLGLIRAGYQKVRLRAYSLV